MSYAELRAEHYADEMRSYAAELREREPREGAYSAFRDALYQAAHRAKRASIALSRLKPRPHVAPGESRWRGALTLCASTRGALHALASVGTSLWQSSEYTSLHALEERAAEHAQAREKRLVMHLRQPALETCPDCDGTGIAPDEGTDAHPEPECRRCRGEGETRT